MSTPPVGGSLALSATTSVLVGSGEEGGNEC